MNSKPATLGGDPIFEAKVPIVKPSLPAFPSLEGELREIIETGMITKGKYLQEFEQAISEHLGVRHAVAVSSCTVGLMLVYKALNLSGDVIVPSFTFMATVSSLVWLGLRPVFIDVDRNTTNIDPSFLEEAITPKTSAVVAVHNFGNPADIEGLEEFATRRGLKLIFDAAHGFGAQYQGSPVGGQGDAQVFSLSPTKLLIAGEGGIVATNDDDLAYRVRICREYGNSGNYDTVFPGINGRLCEFNAVLGLHSLQLLEGGVRNRNLIAELYQRELGSLPGIGFQAIRHGDRSSYKDFGIIIEPKRFGLNRDKLQKALTAENIDTRRYYDPPVHLQTAYRRFTASGRHLANTEFLANSILCLPIWSNMDSTTALAICTAVKRIHEFSKEIEQMGT